MKLFTLLVAVCLIAPMAAMAQETAANPLTATARETFDQYSKNLVATAEEMPAAKYSYHPTPEQMTFGKTKLVAGLKASMDFCADAFSHLTDAKLAEPVTIFGGRRTTRLGAAMEVTNDLIDHYAALAVYLRLNGLLPPTAQKNP